MTLNDLEPPKRTLVQKGGHCTKAIFGDLSGYFFGNFRDKARNII